MSTPLDASTRLRLGFLGVGRTGRQRLEAIARSDLAEIVAIADPDLKAAAAAQAIVPGAVLRRGLDDLLAEGLDGIVIATPSALHSEASIEALRRGVAVLCQHPLGRSPTEARKIVEAARTANKLLRVDMPFRFAEAMQQTVPLIQDGSLGHVFAVNLVFHRASGPESPWAFDAKLSGGGCVMDPGTHLIDLALWSLGFPEVTGVSSQLFAEGRPLRSASGAVEDYATAQLTLAGDRTVQLACSWKLPTGSDCVFEASFYGTKGGVSLRNVNGSLDELIAEQFTGTSRQMLASGADARSGRAAVEWTRRLTESPSFDADIEGVVEVATTIDRIRQGANR